MTTMDRRRLLRSAALLGAGAFVSSACQGASLAGNNSTVDGGPVRIGLLLPQTGTFKALGTDLDRGFRLYLGQAGGKLGGRVVELVTADEGESADSGRAAADRLLKSEQVLAVSGVVNSVVMGALRDTIESAKVPLVGSNASPTTLGDARYIWRTSFRNDEPGRALGGHVAARLGGGSVALIAGDYQAGRDEVRGFTESLTAAGGRVEGDPVWTPHPTTRNFLPYLQRIGAGPAKAVFCFYAGAAAVDFVKQYRQAGLTQQLYAPGFLTEGGVLAAQGDSALGVYTAMNYSVDLPGTVNRDFVAAYRTAHSADPTAYAVASFDAALVLDKAIAAAGADLTRESLNQAIAKVGSVDSPRGAWTFGPDRTPVQKWYLRKVEGTGGKYGNTLVSDLPSGG